MKVVHLTSVHHWQDPRIFAKMLCSIRDAGHEAALVTVGQTPSVHEGIQVISAGDREGRFSNAKRVVRAAGKLDADVYHLHDPELLIAARSLQSGGGKIVYDIHEDYRSKGPILGRLIRSVERWAFGWLDAVVLAESSYGSFIPDGVVKETVLNYHLGGSNDSDRRTMPEEPFEVVYTGVVSELRGLSTILKTARLASVSELPFHFTICGICHSKRGRARAEAFISRHGLDGMVTLTGWAEYATSEQILAAQKSADIGLCVLQSHPNYISTVPTKFYEYMSTGLPFICSDFPAWTKFVEENGCGRVCDPQDSTRLLDEIRTLVATPGSYEKLSAGALEAAGLYRWEVMGEKLLSLYGRLKR
ncbi:MAG: glycosyltransferase [Rhodothermales bacterium]|nr:glycosyltransferase [Rhodothermales bacterium]